MMKKLIILLLIVVTSMTSYAKPKKTIGDVLILTAISSAFLYNGLDYMGDGRWQNGDDRIMMGVLLLSTGMILSNDFKNFYFSSGFDPKMLITNQGYNGIIRLYYQNELMRYGVKYEVFNAIGYHDLALQAQYNQKIGKLGNILPGVQLTSIYNQNTNRAAIGFLFEYNTPSWKRFNLGIINEYQFRPEISKKAVYSNYLILNMKL